jgi:hypothetical protein
MSSVTQQVSGRRDVGKYGTLAYFIAAGPSREPRLPEKETKLYGAYVLVGQVFNLSGQDTILSYVLIVP